MLEDFDRLFHQLVKTQRQFVRLFDEFREQGPKVHVHDLGKTLRLVIEAPGLPKKTFHEWAVRVLDQAIVLRGQYDVEQMVENNSGGFYREKRAERFTRMVPIPYPVRRRPSSVRYEDGLLTVVFDKQRGEGEEGWIPLDTGK